MDAPAGRCASHDLAVGPDGLCVLCRRAAVSSTAAVEPGGPRAGSWVLRLAGLALSIAAFGYGAVLLLPQSARRAAEETAPRSNAATEALVGRQPEMDKAPAVARRPVAPGKEHAVPFSIAEPPTFAPRAARADEVDAGVAGLALATPSATTPGTNGVRSEEELRAAMRRVSVTMYSTEWCPVCTKAKVWLRANGVPFEERDVDKSEIARRTQLSLNPKGGVPTIDIDGEVMVGFGADHMQAALRRAAERRARQF